MTTTTHTIVGVYASRGTAERAITELLASGFSQEQISLMAKNSDSAAPGSSLGDVPYLGPIDTVGSGPGPGTGAAVGSFAGFVAGMVALAIPGIGPILAVGPLTAGLMGAGIGAAAGTVAGALKRQGIPDSEADRYSSALERGHWIVTVQTTGDRTDAAADLMDQHGAIDVDEPAEHLGSHSRVPVPSNTSVPPSTGLTPGAVEAAKLRPGEGVRDRQRERERRVNVFPGFTGDGSVSGTT